ncbi:hypothetical protein PYCC9005_003828 [Savitreella phatthalungensis]
MDSRSSRADPAPPSTTTPADSKAAHGQKRNADQLGSHTQLKALQTRYVQAHTAIIKCVGWNSTGSRVATCSTDRLVKIWNPDKLPKTTDVGTSAGPGGVDPRAARMASAASASATQSTASQGGIIMPNSTGSTANGQYVWTLHGHTASVEKLAWDPTHSDRLCTVSLDRTLRQWDYRTTRELWSCDLGISLINVAYSPDGQHVIVGSRDDTIFVVDLVARKVVSRWKEEKTNINEMAWSNAGTHLALSTQRGTVKILERHPKPARPVKAVVYTPNEFSKDDKVGPEKMEISSDESMTFTPVAELESNTSAAYSLAFDPLGRYLCVGGADAICTVFRLGDWIPLKALIKCTKAVRSLSFSHDGRYIALASEDPRIEIECFDPELPSQHYSTWKEQQEFRKRRREEEAELLIPTGFNLQAVNSVAWHPNKLVLAFAGEDKLLRLCS